METLRIRLLGRFEVERDGAVLPPDAWRRSRPADLLKHVSLAAGRSLSREEAIERLWPDKDGEAGANNLHRALHDLRKIVGTPCLSLEKGLLRLREDVQVDVEAFERCATSDDPARWAEAVALYRGDLCADDPYADAFDRRRVSLRGAFVDVALRLARHQASRSDEGALDTLRRLLSVDPAQEEAHRSLMRLLALAGRRHDALRQFEECERALRESGDLAPSAQTVELQRAILAGELGAGRRSATDGWARVSRRLLGTAKPPLIRGRRAELAEVEAFVRDPSGVLLLMGEAGAGKTRLAIEAARLAATQGATVLAGAALDVGGSAPYAPFVDAWSDHLRAKGLPLTDDPFASFTPRSGNASQEDKIRLFQTVERALGALAGNGTVFLLLDDVQQMDESSLHLLHFLARSSRTQPFLLVATCREEDLRVDSPAHVLLAALHRERLSRRVTLRRLDRDASGELVVDLAGERVDAETLERVFSLAEGNPFYTEEIVRSLQESGTSTVPGDLADMVRTRVSRLGASAEKLLVIASVLGVRFPLEPARAVAGLSLTEAIAALDASVAARVIEEVDEGYRFHHALVRESLYRGLSRTRRAFLHGSVARALEETGNADPEALSWHWQEGGEPARALPHLVEAGTRAARRVGLREAVEFYERALAVMERLGSDDAAQRFRLHYELGQMRFGLSDLDGAVRDLDRAASLAGAEGWRPTPQQRAAARRWAALALINGGDLAGADERLRQALDDLAAVANDPEHAHVLYHLAQLRWHEGKHAEAYGVAERCLREAEKTGHPKAIARGYEMLALACHSLGEWKEGKCFEDKRQELVGGALDVAQAFDVHL